MPVGKAVGIAICRAVGITICRAVGITICRAVGITIGVPIRMTVTGYDIAALDEAGNLIILGGNRFATLRSPAAGCLDEAGVFWFPAYACQPPQPISVSCE